MMLRSLFAIAMLAASAGGALAQTIGAAPAAPVLRANIEISSDIVRIGDVIDNAGDAAQIAIYRAPDLGTTGSLTTANVIAALRAHQVIGVDTRDIQKVSVTRLARTIESKDIEAKIAQLLQHRSGLGDAGDLSLTFDRGLQTVQLDPANNGKMQPASVRYDPRSGRFEVVFEIANEADTAPARLRFTGTAIDTVEAAVVSRTLDRNEILKASDIMIERRPRSEVGREAATRDQAIGMQVRRQLRAGEALRTTDFAKPDLVQRDQAVTIIYRATGITLTIRGKSLENGTEGDVVNVVNLQSKRTFSGVVTGRGQVSVTPQQSVVATAAVPAPVAVAANDHTTAPRKAE